MEIFCAAMESRVLETMLVTARACVQAFHMTAMVMGHATATMTFAPAAIQLIPVTTAINALPAITNNPPHQEPVSRIPAVPILAMGMEVVTTRQAWPYAAAMVPISEMSAMRLAPISHWVSIPTALSHPLPIV